METQSQRDVDGKRWREIEVERKTMKDREKNKQKEKDGEIYKGAKKENPKEI